MPIVDKNNKQKEYGGFRAARALNLPRSQMDGERRNQGQGSQAGHQILSGHLHQKSQEARKKRAHGREARDVLSRNNTQAVDVIIRRICQRNQAVDDHRLGLSRSPQPSQRHGEKRKRGSQAGKFAHAPGEAKSQIQNQRCERNRQPEAAPQRHADGAQKVWGAIRQNQAEERGGNSQK